MAKFVNIQIPLVELSSDSEDEQVPVPPQLPHPPVSPAASHTRTPRLYPTVSDDTSDTPPRAPVAARVSPQPPAPRSPVYRPASPPPAPRVHYQARMSIGPRPTQQPAARDLPAVPFPRSIYEHGESSRRPALEHHMDALSAQVRDARYAFFDMEGSQGRLLGRVGEMETSMVRWRQTVDARAQILTDGLQRNYEEYVRRTSTLERRLMGAVVVAVVAVVVAFLPYFLPRD